MKGVNPNRRAAGLRVGRASKDSGQDFEEFVERHHAEALRLGILAHVVHNEPHGRIFNGAWHMVRAGIADFTGVLFDQGRTLAVEAKKRKDKIEKKDISLEQRNHLDAVVRAGGLAFLLARIVEHGEDIDAEFESDYAVPWQSVPWVILKSAESVTAKDLAPWVIPPDRKCYLEPYCPVRGVVEGAAGRKRVFLRE